MMKNILIFLVFACLTGLIACKQEDKGFKKTASGLEYRIIKSGEKGPVAESGSTVKLFIDWYWHDSLKHTNRDTLPTYQALIPGLIFPYDPFETLTYGVSKGDSIEVRLRVDSLLSQKKIQKEPEGAQTNDAWLVRIKVLEVFPFDPLRSDSIVIADKLREQKLYDSLAKKNQ